MIQQLRMYRSYPTPNPPTNPSRTTVISRKTEPLRFLFKEDVMFLTGAVGPDNGDSRAHIDADVEPLEAKVLPPLVLEGDFVQLG